MRLWKNENTKNRGRSIKHRLISRHGILHPANLFQPAFFTPFSFFLRQLLDDSQSCATNSNEESNLLGFAPQYPVQFANPDLTGGGYQYYTILVGNWLIWNAYRLAQELDQLFPRKRHFAAVRTISGSASGCTCNFGFVQVTA